MFLPNIDLSNQDAIASIMVDKETSKLNELNDAISLGCAISLTTHPEHRHRLR
jgi:hypothetical protein